MTALVITVVAVWLAQRLLSIRQAMKFRDQYAGLRKHGEVAVGMSKKVGRRVYVALAADPSGMITHNVVFRGVTVFANGYAEPRLNHVSTRQVAAGGTAEQIPPMVAHAAIQAAGFLRERRQSAADGRNPKVRG